MNDNKYGSLCRTMYADDTVVIGDVAITVMRIKNKEVKLVIRAPKTTKIERLTAVPNPTQRKGTLYEAFCEQEMKPNDSSRAIKK